MSLQNEGNLNFKNFKIFNLKSQEKWHMDVAPMSNHKEYYKKEGVGFPKSEPWWILWVHVCMWFICASKMYNYALINLLLGLCKFI